MVFLIIKCYCFYGGHNSWLLSDEKKAKAGTSSSFFGPLGSLKNFWNPVCRKRKKMKDIILELILKLLKVVKFGLKKLNKTSHNFHSLTMMNTRSLPIWIAPSKTLLYMCLRVNFTSRKEQILHMLRSSWAIFHITNWFCDKTFTFFIMVGLNLDKKKKKIILSFPLLFCVFWTPPMKASNILVY